MKSQSDKTYEINRHRKVSILLSNPVERLLSKGNRFGPTGFCYFMGIRRGVNPTVSGLLTGNQFAWVSGIRVPNGIIRNKI